MGGWVGVCVYLGVCESDDVTGWRLRLVLRITSG